MVNRRRCRPGGPNRAGELPVWRTSNAQVDPPSFRAVESAAGRARRVAGRRRSKRPTRRRSAYWWPDVPSLPAPMPSIMRAIGDARHAALVDWLRFASMASISSSEETTGACRAVTNVEWRFVGVADELVEDGRQGDVDEGRTDLACERTRDVLPHSGVRYALIFCRKARGVRGCAGLRRPC